MMKVLLLLTVTVVIAGGAETGESYTEETTSTTAATRVPAQTEVAEPATEKSEPSEEQQASRNRNGWRPPGDPCKRPIRNRGRGGFDPCDTRRRTTTTTTTTGKPPVCRVFRCKDNPYRCIDESEKCDGFKHCRDGSDEDPEECKVFTSSLAPGELLTFKANHSLSHWAMEVYLCTSRQCDGLVPIVTRLSQNHSRMDFEKKPRCDTKGKRCYVRTWFSSRTMAGEYTYVVEHRVDHFTLKRTDFPDAVGTIEIPFHANQVLVRPKRYWQPYSVTFGERKRVPAFYSMLMLKLRDGIRDNKDAGTLNGYTEVASTLAQSAEEQRATRWMKLALATRPVPTNASGFVLATDVVQFLTGALGEAQKAKELNDENVKNQLYAKGNAYSKELGKKLNTTTAVLYDAVLPQIQNLVKTLENQTDEAKKKRDDAGTEAGKKQAEIDKLEKGVIAAKFFYYLSKVMGIVASVMGANKEMKQEKTAVGVGGKAYDLISSEVLGKLQGDIKSLQSDIRRLKKTQDSMKNLLELLTMCLDLVRDLDRVKGSDTGLRGWLAGPAMLSFKSRLIMLSGEDLPVATSGLILIDIVTEVGRSIVEMLDKIEWYETQQVIVDLTTPPLSSADSTEVREGLGAMRQLVGQHMVVTDYRATMRSLQLYALPFCSLLVTAEAERCLEGYDLNGTASCASYVYDGLLARLQRDKASITGKSRTLASFYRDEDSDRSFITWSQKEHSALIADVLSGKRVVLSADVYEGMDDTFVVKFKEIGLTFWHDDEEVREQLNTALEAFKLSLTHMGSSHFRCGSEVLALSHRVINIVSTFLSDDAGLPQDFSEEYSKLRAGDMLVSPYGMWTVQIVPYSNNADFSALQRFASVVDMSLSGEGSYVTGDVSCEGCVWDYKVPPPHSNSTAAMGPRKRRLFIQNQRAPKQST